MLQIIVALPLSFLLLYWIWPSILGWSIRRSSEGKWGGWIHGHVGPVIIGLTFILAIGLGSWFVLADKEKSWTDPESAVGALGIAAGAVFAYSRLFPPAFWPSFYEIIDFHTTGEWKRPKLTEITIGQGQFWPIFVEVHNAGMTPWNNYRITVGFQEGGCQVYPEHPQIPASLHWQWKTVFRPLGEGQQFLQVQATNILSVAESQTIRFVVKAPDKGGRFKVRIMVVADGRLGESRRDLVINVVEGLQPPPIPVAV